MLQVPFFHEELNLRPSVFNPPLQLFVAFSLGKMKIRLNVEPTQSVDV